LEASNLLEYDHERHCDVFRIISRSEFFKQFRARVELVMRRSADGSVPAFSIWSEAMNEIEHSKTNVVAFYEMMFNDCRPREAIERYAGADYIQHNPHVPTGKTGFIDYFERMAREWPGKHVEIKRVVAEGDLVVLQCLQRWPGDQDYAAIDIFRLDENGRIVEHWDVLQAMPKEAAHANGMF
jgi:predicted SnoaL-like aldol condensation-catalyzing enzyme